MTRLPTETDLWEDSFGVAEPFALGVEEELLLVGPGGELIERGQAVVRAMDPDEGEVEGELFQAMVESQSEISRTVGEATSALAEIRQQLVGRGSRIMGVGVHPASESGEAAIAQARRYAVIQDSLRGLLRTPICGQHIHVGMPDAATAVNAYNGIRTHVPLINALAANSPFWFGEDSGLASSRTVIFRSYPRAAMGPQFDDFEHFCHVTRQVCAAAGLDDYTHIWWDVRIHPGLGTIEIRAADTQSDLRRNAALTALVHCLTRIEAENPQDRIPSREALAESSFQAIRHGLNAVLLDRDCQPVPARQLAGRCLAEAGEVAGDLGCEDELAHLETMLEEGNGADLQRAVHAERGMDGLLTFLVDLTSASAEREAGQEVQAAAEVAAASPGGPDAPGAPSRSGT